MHELSRDLILKTTQIIALISVLPGIGSSRQQQEDRLKELEEELKEVEKERQEAVKERERLVEVVENVIAGVGKRKITKGKGEDEMEVERLGDKGP